MAERIITTEGLVVGQRDNGEAARTLDIFSRELGLVSVYAAGIRYEKSKLRYHTQLYDLSLFSLVPGREHWRLIGAVALSRSAPMLYVITRVTALITRFLGPGEPHPELFDSIFTIDSQDPYLSLEIMNRLGYVEREPISLREAEQLLDQAVRASHL
ncbi:MAG TPA: recombination protein O N-terminal domain-containing protein [Candidatus Paceibacterota bacterium]